MGRCLKPACPACEAWLALPLGSQTCPKISNCRTSLSTPFCHSRKSEHHPLLNSENRAMCVIYLIILCLPWASDTVQGLSLVVASRSYSLLQLTGFSLGWLLLAQSTGSSRLQKLQHAGSVVAAHGLHCSAACVTLIPEPRVEPMSLALASRFLATGFIRKSLYVF